jgi:putative flippase GtrA
MRLIRTPGAITGALDTVRWRLSGLLAEIAKFGTVGLMALVVDVGLFNLLRFAGPDGEGLLYAKPLTAKLLSVVVAITFSFYANRHWTYRDRARTGFGREYVLFVTINGVATLIALGTLWTSHYALGLTSPLADNISANVVGLVLGTLFRFWAYRTYVFPEEASAEAAASLASPLADAGSSSPASGAASSADSIQPVPFAAE